MNNPTLIDTDSGVDDALALILALRSPELSVRAITTVAGNTTVGNCTRNVRRVLGLLNSAPDILVARGAAGPLKRRLVTAHEVHGDDGLGNVRMKITAAPTLSRGDAVNTILQHCDRYARSLTIVALGPLTNIALALRKRPASLRKAGRIISMGGAFRVPGNTGPVAEFNYYVDPEAAERVLTSGLPLFIVPLDLTEQVALMRKELVYRASRRPNDVSRFILGVTRLYMKYHKHSEGFEGGFLHDPVAVGAAIDPGLFEWSRMDIRVETTGKWTRGMTVADPRGKTPASRPAPRVAFRMNKEAFLKLFHERLWA